MVSPRHSTAQGDSAGAAPDLTDQIFCHSSCGTGILSCDEIAVNDHMRAPVGPGAEKGSQFLESFLKEKGQYAVKSHLLLLGVGNGGDFFAVDHRISVAPPCLEQRRCAVADGAHGFAAFKEGGGDPGVAVVICQIPDGTVSAGVEEGAEIVGVHIGKSFRSVKNGVVPGDEASAVCPQCPAADAPGIDGDLSACGGGGSDLESALQKAVVAAGELLKVQPRLLCRISHTVMGGGDDEYSFHCFSPLCLIAAGWFAGIAGMRLFCRFPYRRSA